MTRVQQQLCGAGSNPQINFFDVYNRLATVYEARLKLQAYRASLRAKGKRGGPNQNTKEVMFAIFTSVCQTMNRLQHTQPDLFRQCIEDNQYFCFTTLPSLQTMVNKGKEFDDTGIESTDTIRNQINLLIKAEVLTSKQNYQVTDNKNADPLPEDKKDKGHGKIQLFINPNVFCTTLGQMAPSDSEISDSTPPNGNIEESFNLYPLSNEELKEEITNTIDDSEENKALANAKLIFSSMSGEVRASKPPQTEVPRKKGENLAGPAKKSVDGINEAKRIALKMQHQWNEATPMQATTYALWEMLRAQLYQGEFFNQDVQNTSMQMLEGLLLQTHRNVRKYRAKKLKQLQESPKYLEKTPKQQKKLVNWVQRRLPNIERSAVEIFSNAIDKQKKHCDKKHYQVWQPVSYLSSWSIQKALEYSLDDWTRLKEGFFDKNLKSLERFSFQQHIQEIYSSVLESSRAYGRARSHQFAQKQYHKFIKELKQSQYLDPNTQIELEQVLTQKLKTIFRHA